MIRLWLRRCRAFMSEQQLCPNRVDGPFKLPKTDHWEEGRWGTRLTRWLEDALNNRAPARWMRALHDALRRRGIYWQWLNRSYGGTRWEWPWQPRTCSYCGGLHPDDAVRLVSEGWEPEGTGKSYKAYLNPPGHTAALRARYPYLMRRGMPPEALPPATWSPVPPLKLYRWHFSEEKHRELMKARDAR